MIKKLRRAAALFGAASCISCTILSGCILVWGRVLLIEPNAIILFLETAIGITGITLNLYFLYGRD